MAMHAVHKMLARASGKAEVNPGEVVTAKVDVVGINDVYPIVMDSFYDMNGETVWDPEKVYLFLDHMAPAQNLGAAKNQRVLRDFAAKTGCHLIDINRGICHTLFPEWGKVKPGDVVIITDSHTCIHGAYGAFAAGVGATDVAAILIDGTLWLRIPEVVNVRLTGKLQEGVLAKDAALFILGELGTDFGNYKVIEFSGPVVESMCVAERTVLTVMATEMGAKATYIKPDATTLAYVASKTAEPFIVDETDAAYVYAAEHTFDLSDLKPQVAVPHSVDNARDVEAVQGLQMDQIFVGSCTGGKFLDIEIVAKVLKGKEVHPSTRLVVTPATKEVFQECMAKGYIQDLVAAGATITAPGCGACSGLLGGVIAPFERCASTANRNFPGRMGGSLEAEVFLVSPLTAAATALTGKLEAGKLGADKLETGKLGAGKLEAANR
ncbi:MAG: 2,3-dimethylmalate dehydratase large subunit [Desulfovibrio sp.]